ncbi:glutamate-cysteine ligase family protein [Fluviispira vulneris]|uniref:glutamate-cysteine ligase family protein n=1 Tax=Fluviispira vulneris TaxID=2763012 RepID=UPI0016471487|nr:glutamate-cysteine ligase family protein [Fluviispira vulneris]
MSLQNSTDIENICSRVWIKPIKGNRAGIEKMGLEMEMHAFDSKTLAPIGTENSKINIQTLLKRIGEIAPDAKLKFDKATGLITTVFLKSGGNFSAEPGGQVEYSSDPFEKLSDLSANVADGLKLLEKASAGDLVFLSHGTNPISADDHPLLLPKERYKIMTRYFNSAPQIRGIDMMRHSATVQANVDIFGDENWEDAVNLTLVLIPLTAKLFANSKYFKNKKSQFFSERQEIWQKMDPSRSGIPANLPFAENLECEYATWGKKAFVFFVDGLPIEEQPLFGELTFEDWLKNGYKGTKPTVESWETHLGTLFPHLRLRDFLEIRHIDAQPFEHTFAPIAFFSAVLKSSKIRRQVWEIINSEKIDLKNLFHSQEDYSKIHFPLLDFACSVLDDLNEKEGVQALQAYKKFVVQKNDYWQAEKALEFVQKNKTLFPSEEFLKHLK